MHSTILLVRNAATDWTRDGRVTGRRDLSLSTEGRAQAEALAGRLAAVDVAEVLVSPQLHAVETAERIASRHGLDAARDPRLADLAVGAAYEGLARSELAGREEYRRWVADPLGVQIAGVEPLVEARDRVVSSVTQALTDNEVGANVVLVSHSGALRLLLAHFLGMGLANYHRLRLSPASVSVLRFDSEFGVPRLLAMNWSDALEPALR